MAQTMDTLKYKVKPNKKQHTDMANPELKRKRETILNRLRINHNGHVILITVQGWKKTRLFLKRTKNLFKTLKTAF